MKTLFILLTCITIVVGCGENKTSAEKANTNVVGGDLDKHGCKASAGYQWCTKTQQCERPWELAKTEQFENDSHTFNAFCGNQGVE